MGLKANKTKHFRGRNTYFLINESSSALLPIWFDSTGDSFLSLTIQVVKLNLACTFNVWIERTTENDLLRRFETSALMFILFQSGQVFHLCFSFLLRFCGSLTNEIICTCKRHGTTPWLLVVIAANSVLKSGSIFHNRKISQPRREDK